MNRRKSDIPDAPRARSVRPPAAAVQAAQPAKTVRPPAVQMPPVAARTPAPPRAARTKFAPPVPVAHPAATEKTRCTPKKSVPAETPFAAPPRAEKARTPRKSADKPNAPVSPPINRLPEIKSKRPAGEEKAASAKASKKPESPAGQSAGEKNAAPAKTPKTGKKTAASVISANANAARTKARKTPLASAAAAPPAPKTNAPPKKNAPPKSARAARPAERPAASVENTPAEPPATAAPPKKRIKPLGATVVRGRLGRYDFEVFPLDAEIRDGAAIFVISRRIIDQRGRGHHKFVCLGQTESLVGALRRHRRNKCFKRFKANVVCLLRENDEVLRARIEADLRGAHTIACEEN